jgi:hypothetical protein
VEQAVQIVGSLLILVPFTLVQVGRMATGQRTYQALNLVGSFVLAVVAGVTGQWGFLLLEGVWAVVSGIALGRAVLGQRAPGAPPA